MLLPSKLVPFAESTLANLVPVLSLIPEEGIGVVDLYLRCLSGIKSPEAVIDALTVLFAIGAVKLDETKEVIHRA